MTRRSTKVSLTIVCIRRFSGLNYSITHYQFRLDSFIREIRGYPLAPANCVSSSLYNDSSPNLRRRDGRVAEGARLESVFRGNSNVGSNPTLSAIPECLPCQNSKSH